MLNPNDDFNIWEGIYSSFEAADAAVIGPGFEGDTHHRRAIEAAKECLTAVKAGTPMPPFYKQRSAMLPPVIAMMLQDRDQRAPLRILDLGGGLGIGYMVLLESVPDAAKRIDYTVVEVPGICTAGRDLFGNAITFVETLPPRGPYDLVNCSSVLQYIQSWPQLLGDLSRYGAPYWLLSDIFAGEIPTFVTLQNYYGSRIKHWFLNIHEFMDVIARLHYQVKMKSYVAARRLHTYDVLPMNNFPVSHRLEQTLHLLLQHNS